MKQAFEQASSALVDSIRTLDSARDLLDGQEKKDELLELSHSRQRFRRALIDTGLSAGLPIDDVEARGIEKARRAWMALKSSLTTDSAVLKVVVDEERDAMKRLENAIELGLPEPVERAARSAVADVSDGIDKLEAVMS